MKKILLLLLCVPLIGIAQTCSYSGDKNSGIPCVGELSNIYYNDVSAINAIDRILSVSGLSKRFDLIRCNEIENAAAVIGPRTGKRYILYNTNFMKRTSNRTEGWSYLSILAHEIGHHVNGHTLLANSSIKDAQEMELEADSYSGFIMYKLGSTLEEAQQSVRLHSSNYDDTYTKHPNLNKRLLAIKEGYNNAKNIENEVNTNINKGESKFLYKDCFSGDCVNGSGVYKMSFGKSMSDPSLNSFKWEGKFKDGWLYNGSRYESYRGVEIQLDWGTFKVDNTFFTKSRGNRNDWKPGGFESIILHGYGCETGEGFGKYIEDWDDKKIGTWDNGVLVEGHITSHSSIRQLSGKFIWGEFLHGDGRKVCREGNSKNQFPYKIVREGEFKYGLFVSGKYYDYDTGEDITNLLGKEGKWVDFREAFFLKNHIELYELLINNRDYEKGRENFWKYHNLNWRVSTDLKELYDRLKFKPTRGRYSKYTDISFEEFKSTYFPFWSLYCPTCEDNY